MMKLSFSLTLIWTLFSTAGALQCQTCTDPTDINCAITGPVTCPTQTECVTATVQASAPQNTLQQVFKTCAPASVCSSPGSQSFSVSTSGLSASAAAQCCNTDNCNTATLSAPGTQAVNSLKCFTCDTTNSNCSTQIQCKGVENRCFRANVTLGTTYSLTLGCASANLCAAAANISSLPVVGGASNVTCCGTSLCNSAPPAATTTIYFLLGLLVFSLY